MRAPLPGAAPIGTLGTVRQAQLDRPGDAPPRGWSGLFWTAFKQSQNAMALIDEGRRHVEVNGAYLALTGYRRLSLLGRPIHEIVVGGPRLTEAEWQRALRGGDAFGDATVSCEDGHVVFVEYAAHPEVVTGRR